MTIDETLLRQLKEHAAKSGRTVSALIEDAVRAMFGRPESEPDELEPLVTYGGSGVMPGIDLTDMRSVRDAMDDGESIGALR